MNRTTPLLVLGLGNLLLEDDGVGSAAVALLNERYAAPEGTQVLDGGTLGLSLLPYLEDAATAILVDAIRADGQPGDFVRLDGEEVGPAVATRLSPHQIGVSDLLDGARWRDRYPKRVILLGLVPASMELSVELSPRVRQALPGLVERVVEEARALGFTFQPKSADDRSVAGRRAAGGVDVSGLQRR
jgi:hydrogenase maturation protease